MSKIFCKFVFMKGFLKFLWNTGNIIDLCVLLILAVLFMVISVKEKLIIFAYIYVIVFVLMVINKWLLYKRNL